jgi:hypothetical protein
LLTESSQDSVSAGSAWPRPLPWLACALVYLALCAAYAQVWEPAHDEGVTWTQAFGPLDLPLCDATVSTGSALRALEGGEQHSSEDVVAALLQDGMHPPAYYLLVNAWASWLGTQRLPLSLPAIFLGVLSLLAIGRLANSLASGRAAGFWAMALLATSPWFVGYSIFARPYGLVMFASLWSSVAVLEMQVGGRSVGHRLCWRLAFVASSCLGLYSLYHYAFVLLWQGVALLLLASRSGGRRATEVAWLLGMAAAIAGLYVPWLPGLVTQLAAASARAYYFSGWLPMADWPAAGARLLAVFTLGEGLWSTWAEPLRLALLGMTLCTLPLALRSYSPRRLKTLAPAARMLWLASPLLPLAILASDWLRDSHTLFISKTSFSLLPLLLCCVVRAWQELPLRRVATAALAFCVLLSATSTLGAIRTRDHFYSYFEIVAEYLSRSDAPSHRVVLSSDRRGYAVPLLLALRDAGVRAAHITLAPENQLAACVDSLLANPETERLTLVDFAVPYEPRDSWDPAELRSAARRARSASWYTLRLPAGDGESWAERARDDAFWARNFLELEGNPRVLLVVSPARSKNFSE